MTVYKNFFDLSKEEKWLADMARQGYRLYKASYGSYKFNRLTDENKEYTFRIDYRTFHKNEDYLNYCTMFEDSGWMHIAGTRWSGNQYFVKARPDASEDIFSDRLSRASRYKRISDMWLSLSICYIMLFIVFFTTGTWHFKPNELYLTPGLWELKGWHFLAAFLFETPFALFRFIPFVIYLILAVFYIFFTIKSYSFYKKELN